MKNKFWNGTSSIAAIITLSILILATFGGIVSSSAKAQDGIKENSNNIVEIKENSNSLNQIVLTHENRIAIVETHFEHIESQLNRIEEKLK